MLHCVAQTTAQRPLCFLQKICLVLLFSQELQANGKSGNIFIYLRKECFNLATFFAPMQRKSNYTTIISSESNKKIRMVFSALSLRNDFSTYLSTVN